MGSVLLERSSMLTLNRISYLELSPFVGAVVFPPPSSEPGSHWVIYGVSQFPIGGGPGTVYLTTGFDADEAEIAFPAPAPFRVLKFNVECVTPPGVGETFTYRLRKKPTGGSFGDTGLSAAISGSSIDGQIDGSVDYQRRDLFVIALDKTSGVPATKHSWSVEIELL